MSESKIETAKGLSAVALTKYIMGIYDIPQDEAYKKLITMECYLLLMDDETRLYLEPDSYMQRCCEIELSSGKDALYEFIKTEE